MPFGKLGLNEASGGGEIPAPWFDLAQVLTVIALLTIAAGAAWVLF